VKPQSLTGTVEGFDGSFCETPSYFSMHYWKTALQNEKKKRETSLPKWHNRRINGHLVKTRKD
jgi:hypothetical protein